MLSRAYGLFISLAFLGALAGQVYVPRPDWQLYFAECCTFAVFLGVDGLMRRAAPLSILAHATAAVVVAPIAVARWYARRPLSPGESRQGGAEANFYTALGVTTIVFTGVSAASNFLNFGPDRGFELIINCGFSVGGTLLVMGLLARQERVFERGPNIRAKGAAMPKQKIETDNAES